MKDEQRPHYMPPRPVITFRGATIKLLLCVGNRGSSMVSVGSHRLFVFPYPPHPNPLPKEREWCGQPAERDCTRNQKPHCGSPSLWGEGWGEGDGSARQRQGPLRKCSLLVLLFIVSLANRGFCAETRNPSFQ